METIPEEKWGRDHLSLLVYCETRAVDHRGILDNNHLRRAEKKRGASYPTRLANNAEVIGHDDIDCLDDLEAAGLIINRGTGLHPVIEMTDKGWEKAWTLRRNRAEEGRKNK